MRSVRKIKAKYYTKEALKYLLLMGAIVMSGSGPSLGLHLAREIFREKVTSRKQAYDTFRYLRRKGFVELRREGHDIAMTLTSEGKKQAGKFQIDDLVIERSKKWDRKWRIIVFDIPVASNTVRDIFRRKLKEFGFYRLQKSIWVFPFECREEIQLLRDFLEVGERQIIYLEAMAIEGDLVLKQYFRL
jgi:DNA-binding PadR family transcriptional regulator